MAACKKYLTSRLFGALKNLIQNTTMKMSTESKETNQGEEWTGQPARACYSVQRKTMSGNTVIQEHRCHTCRSYLRQWISLLMVCLLLVVFTLVVYSYIINGMVTVAEYTQMDGRKFVTDTPTRRKLNSAYNKMLDIQRQYLRNTAIYLHKAHLHARGVKTNDALKNAIENFSELLHTFNLSFATFTERKVMQSKNICPEKITSSMTGFPLFEVGYIVQNCSHAAPLETIVTVLMLCPPDSIAVLNRTLKGLFGYLPNIPVIIGAKKPSIDQLTFTKSYSSVWIEEFSDAVTEGDMWNGISSKVKTEYALIARGVMSFNSDARIDRMVREMEMLNVTVVGGSIRHVDNKWKIGCHQRAFRNFTVSFMEGYDESIHDCLFCDHVDGPFLIRKTDLMRNTFDGNMPEMGLFEDFFMRLGGEIALCPDAMYYTNIPDRSREPSQWKVFGGKRSLYELKLSTGATVNFGCEAGSYLCNKISGKMLSPCCMLELSRLNTRVDKVCTEGNVICQVHAGTLLGAAKFYNVLPWERDGDIQLYAGNFTAAGTLGGKFIQKGYRFSKGRNGYPCQQKKAPGYYEISSKYWRIEWWCFCEMQPLIQRQNALNNTLIPMAGRYVVGPRNPVLFARNRYPNFFGHSEHYSVIGQRSNDIYKQHKWFKCTSPGAHDCLDNYRVDGNLQFMNVIP